MKNQRSTAQRIHLLLLAAILLSTFLVFVIHGCNSSTSAPQTGTVAVSLTDAPACGFDAVNVTISKIRIHQSNYAEENDPGWAEIILNPARKINLLNLTNGVLENLGETPLVPGHYTQLRLLLAGNSGQTIANSVIPTGTSSEIALDTPSAMQSGLKLINEFEVVAGERVDLVLDFNACKSVVTRGNGNYGLKPAIRVLPLTLSGIEGFVTPGERVTISAQSSGTILRSTIANPLTGKFFLSHLAPGNYDVVITAPAHAPVIVTGVPIASVTSIAILSDQKTPIILPTSATHNISGTIVLNPLSSNEVATASAKQTFLPGPTTVIVQSQTVDLFSDAYTLTLPSAAPLYGNYGSGTLPLTLSPQNAAAGLYEIEASAPGYKSQSFNKDVATTDESQNFILVP